MDSDSEIARQKLIDAAVEACRPEWTELMDSDQREQIAEMLALIAGIAREVTEMRAEIALLQQRVAVICKDRERAVLALEPLR